MQNINFKHLYYFWVVAREGSISRASEALNITPQTISAQLTTLESRWEVPLFTREGRSLRLTEAGKFVQSYADAIFSLGAELDIALQQQQLDQTEKLTVGAVDVLPKLITHLVLKPFIGQASSPSLVCKEGKFDELLPQLAMHKLDVLLSDRPVPPAPNLRLYNHRLGECGVSILAAPSLIDDAAGEFPNNLNHQPFLLPTTNNTLRSALEQWFAEQGIAPHIVAEFDDSALVKAFGHAGAGFFACPSAIEEQVCKQYSVALAGRIDGIREQFYAISTEKKLKKAAVIALTENARDQLFK
ncbi:transcriptional activator NhaR [Spongiibacter marinus]|uniref:transcriptional activator NhaR n=1 Tax=Spongiibacter marinus TaxID=354246 RepID=UPI003565B839